MDRSIFFVAALSAVALGTATQAEQIPVKHLQTPVHRFMVARSEAGKVIARVEFSQAVQGDQVTMHLIYRFGDGSIDDETTTYTQDGTFRLVRDRHIQTGPFFSKPVDFAVDDTTGTATSRKDISSKTQIESKHVELPDDLANGIVGTLLLNAPLDKGQFQVGLLVPLQGGRLIRIVISQEGEQSFRLLGQPLKARVFRIHPELGGIVGWIASLIGVQPKDVMVWVKEGDEPAVVKIVGQLGGYGPIVDSELDGASFGN
jgi:hypothetical protein